MIPPLTDRELQQFIEQGFVILRGGFSREQAERGRDYLWKKIGLSPDDPSGWKEKLIHVQEAFRDGPFHEILNQRIFQAVSQLAGENRAIVHDFFGWWPVLFPGFEGPGGWHVDGSNFHHRLQSKEQALVTLYLFSDIRPGDGGTALFKGSHHAVARILRAAEPDGLTLDELMDRLPPVEPDKIVEVTGEAGDIAFLHPFLIHGFGANSGERVRFACNPQYSFKTEMDLSRTDGNHSPVEEAIRVALDLAHS